MCLRICLLEYTSLLASYCGVLLDSLATEQLADTVRSFRTQKASVRLSRAVRITTEQRAYTMRFFFYKRPPCAPVVLTKYAKQRHIKHSNTKYRNILVVNHTQGSVLSTPDTFNLKLDCQTRTHRRFFLTV